jgi:hypothetical protein
VTSGTKGLDSLNGRVYCKGMKNTQVSQVEEHIVQCAECGHLHFDAANMVYVECPLDDGCEGQDLA